VVVGALRSDAATHTFTYGRSYIDLPGVPLYLPELPLVRGEQRPDPSWEAHGCILDAGPDYWGRRVYEHQATLGELMSAADSIQAGETLSPALTAAMLRGTSIGGARPKALVEDGERCRWQRLGRRGGDEGEDGLPCRARG
jgi:serine/threonine-protein kinase HipA